MAAAAVPAAATAAAALGDPPQALQQQQQQTAADVAERRGLDEASPVVYDASVDGAGHGEAFMSRSALGNGNAAGTAARVVVSEGGGGGGGGGAPAAVYAEREAGINGGGRSSVDGERGSSGVLRALREGDRSLGLLASGGTGQAREARVASGSGDAFAEQSGRVTAGVGVGEGRAFDVAGGGAQEGAGGGAAVGFPVVTTTGEVVDHGAVDMYLVGETAEGEQRGDGGGGGGGCGGHDVHMGAASDAPNGGGGCHGVDERMMENSPTKRRRME